MKCYSFLNEALETAPVQQIQQTPVNKPITNKKRAMEFNSLFKPLNISGISIKTRNRIMAEADAKLSQINQLTYKLKAASSNPENKNAQTDKIKLKFAQDAYKIHHEFISKTIFWKSRVKMIMGPQFMQLKEQYTRNLFTLEQAYKRTILKLKPADTSNY